jgi:hypothetical protein
MMNAVWHGVLIGLPILLIHLTVTTALLIGGVAIYVYAAAPYREIEQIREGNVAAAIVLSGQILAIAIPARCDDGEQHKRRGYRPMGHRRHHIAVHRDSRSTIAD